MNNLDLENLIKERLNAAGLGRFLDHEREQYLEFPDGFFAEIVLEDAAKIPDAERVIRSVKEELESQGIELHAIVRAIWGLAAVTIVPVHPPRFVVTLRSGTREQKVTVNVTGAAFEEIRSAARNGGLREYGADESSILVGIVSEFVRLELSYGGESYWPVLERPQLELNEWALQYLMIHGPAKAS